MEVFTTVSAVREWSRETRHSGRTVGLVPTMGALHDGHTSLVAASNRSGHATVVSVFVNERQFGEKTDFAEYPRDTDRDLRICREAGVAAVFLPSAEEMWPHDAETLVEPGPVALPLEGAFRPGHFTAVATVVLKLINATSPDEAFFGLKDLQQVAVVRSVVRDLHVPVRIVSVPTVREPDGLAMSSRNVRLSATERRAAACLPRALSAARRAFHLPGRSLDDVRAAALAVITAEPACALEYLEIVDPDTLTPASGDRGNPVICVAARFGAVRLIDNLDLRSPDAL